jgi:hypothetical protein
VPPEVPLLSPSATFAKNACSRCTAHGMMRSLFHLASLCAIPIYGMFSQTMLMFPAVITISLTFGAAIMSLKIQDNSKVLL